MRIGKINRESTALLIIDIQEGLMPSIPHREKIIHNANKLIKGAGILNIPVIVTEQYPKGLKNTCKEIDLPEGQQVIEKISFSCFLKEDVITKLESYRVKSLLIAGVESHICVLKTALDALEKGYEAHIASDAIGSRTFENKAIAIERMRQSGAFIASTEMILFQLMDYAKTDEFKLISTLIK